MATDSYELVKSYAVCLIPANDVTGNVQLWGAAASRVIRGVSPRRTKSGQARR